jgi:colanic acid/amylovoran biosynthesis glycosyltransferase
VTVARLVEKKGVAIAIQAVAIAARTARTLLHYDIIGDGPLRASLEDLTRTLGVADIVQFHGERDKAFVAETLDRAHIFVLASVTGKDGDQEGTPVSLLEAQASGLPVLSTFHSGIPEIVSDGRSGFLVKERDAAALAERIVWLVQRPESWAAMGHEGRALVERDHDQTRLTEQLEGIYRQAASRRAGELKGTHR